MVNGDNNPSYGACGPFTDSIKSILLYVENHNVVGYKSICVDQEDARWIVIQSTDTPYNVQGPFVHGIDKMVMNEDSWIIGITLGQDNGLANIRGLGRACNDFQNTREFWVLSKRHDSNDFQSTCAPLALPSNFGMTTIDPHICPNIDLQNQRIDGGVLQGMITEDVNSCLLQYVDSSSDLEKNEELEGHSIIFNRDGTNFGATHEDEGLGPLIAHDPCPMGLVEMHIEVPKEGDYLHGGESSSSQPFDFFSYDHLEEVFGQSLTNQVPLPRPNDLMEHANNGVGCGSTIMLIDHEVMTMSKEIVGNNDAQGLLSMMPIYGNETLHDNRVLFEQDQTHLHIGELPLDLEGQLTTEEMVFSTPDFGDPNEPPRKKPRKSEPPSLLLGETFLNGIIEATPTFGPIVASAENYDVSNMHEEAQLANSPSTFTSRNSMVTSPNHVDSQGVMGMDTNGSDHILDDVMGPLEQDSLQPLFDQETRLATQSLRVNPTTSVDDFSKDGGFEDGKMEVALEEIPIFMTNTNSRGDKLGKRKSKYFNFKQHGVVRREGGRKSFVAYFRPKDLPESNKTFLTIGEFSNEEDAWNAFNLFAFVHEGEGACIDMANKDSIELEAEVWREFPRVDLVAYLRLRNKRGVDKDKIRWFCDVLLVGGVTDPRFNNDIKETSTYETPEEAAKEADRLMVLNEGYMAWTNYTLTDYLAKAVKDQWDPTWIPLQDNPRKYLSTQKHNSF